MNDNIVHCRWLTAIVPLIPDHCNTVIQKAPHQRSQLSAMSPQSFCRARVVVVCDMWGEDVKRNITLCLHVLFIIIFY